MIKIIRKILCTHYLTQVEKIFIRPCFFYKYGDIMIMMQQLNPEAGFRKKRRGVQKTQFFVLRV